MAKELTAEDVEGLYACMVHPPIAGQNIPVEEWMMRVMYAAVCLLARLGRRFTASQSEEMRSYAADLPSPELVRICLGQLDWPVIPALTVLAWQVQEGIADLDPAFTVLHTLWERVSQESYCFFEHALVCAFTWIPGLKNEAFYATMRKRRLTLESQ